MMHPHVHPTNVGKNALQQGGKGFILQQRLQNRMNTAYGTATVAVHAMFTHYVLTMQHARKWDILRHAVELGVEISDRTLALALEVFAKERGARCGPKTMRALVRALASHGSAKDLVFALYSCRRNELLPEFCDLPPVEFEEEEVVFVMSRLQSRSQEDKAFALVAPLVSVLMIETDPVKLEGTIRHVLSGGNASAHFELPSSTTSDALHSTPHTMPAAHTAPIADQYNETTMLPSEARSSTSDVKSNRTELMELLQTSVIPRAHRKKLKRRSKSSAITKGTREPETTINVVVGSPLEGRTLTEKLTSDLYSDARALNVASMVFELEQHREEERKRHAATAWINPDY
jgi:hypothetical protein